MKEQEIIKFLKKRYNVKAIVIVGSRAIGDYKSGSDWDIYIFSDKKFRKETPNEFYNVLPSSLKNEDLDIYKNSMDVASYGWKLWRDLRNSKIVFDTNGFAKKLIVKVLKLYKKGPKKWTKEYAQGRVYKAQRYMKKFKDSLKDKKNGELFMRICWHYSENIIDWWFGIRREWPMRIRDAFPYIKNKDPKFYAQLKKVFNETSYKVKIDAFKKIHKILFNSKDFKRLVK